jgi:hypothetical protein
MSVVKSVINSGATQPAVLHRSVLPDVSANNLHEKSESLLEKKRRFNNNSHLGRRCSTDTNNNMIKQEKTSC